MRARALSFVGSATVAVAVATGGLGCVPINNTSDFMEMHGSFIDGHKIDQHLPATTGVVPSLSTLGTVTAVGAQATGPDDLRGFRIEWIAGDVQAGTTYPSTVNGPVVFFIIGPDASTGGASPTTATFATGNITFSQVSGAPNAVIKGTVADVALESDGKPFITLDSGSFQATQP